jgi:hypothetical protein
MIHKRFPEKFAHLRYLVPSPYPLSGIIHEYPEIIPIRQAMAREQFEEVRPGKNLKDTVQGAFGRGSPIERFVEPPGYYPLLIMEKQGNAAVWGTIVLEGHQLCSLPLLLCTEGTLWPTQRPVDCSDSTARLSREKSCLETWV